MITTMMALVQILAVIAAVIMFPLIGAMALREIFPTEKKNTLEDGVAPEHTPPHNVALKNTPLSLFSIPEVSASFVFELNELGFLDTSVAPVKDIGRPCSQYLVDELLKEQHRPANAAQIETLSVEDIKALEEPTSGAVAQDVKQINNSSIVEISNGPLSLVPSKAAPSRGITLTLALPDLSTHALYREFGLTNTVLLDVRASSMALITSADALISRRWLVRMLICSPWYKTNWIRSLVPGRKRGIDQVDEPAKNCDRKRRLLKACKQRKPKLYAGWWIPIIWEPVELKLKSFFPPEVDFCDRLYPQFYYGFVGFDYFDHVHYPARFQHHDLPLRNRHVETSRNVNPGVIGAGRPRRSRDSTDSESHSSVECTPSPINNSLGTNATSPTESNQGFESDTTANSNDHHNCRSHTHIAEKYEGMLKEKDALIAQLQADNNTLIEEKVDLSDQLEKLARAKRRAAASFHQEIAAERSENAEAKRQLGDFDRHYDQLDTAYENERQTVRELKQSNEELQQVRRSHQRELKALQSQYEGAITELEDKIKELKEENANTWQREGELIDRDLELQKEIEGLQNQRNGYEGHITTLTEEIQGLRERLNEA